MKKTLTLLLLLLIFDKILYAQTETNYIIEFTESFQTETFKNADHFIDIEGIKGNKKKFQKLIDVIDKLKINKIRKLIRRLPDDKMVLKTRNNVDFDISRFQRLFFVETDGKIPLEKTNSYHVNISFY